RFEGTGPSSTRDLPAVSGAGRGLGRIRPVVVMARPPFDWVVAASLPDASLPEPSPPEPSLLAAPMAGWRGHEVAHQDEHAGAQDDVADADHADRGHRDDVTEEPEAGMRPHVHVLHRVLQVGGGVRPRELHGPS